MTRCPAQYQRPAGREPGDRIVECHLVDCHVGDHQEAGTGFAWSDPMPTACDRTDMPEDPDAHCAGCGQRAGDHANWHPAGSAS